MSIINEALVLVKSSSSQYSEFITLAGENSDAADQVLRYSDSVASLAKNSILARTMARAEGEKAVWILKFGGSQSLESTEVLKERMSAPNELTKSMQFGNAGLQWVKYRPIDDLIVKIRSIRTTFTGKMWYNVKYVFSLIPFTLVLLIMAFLGLTLCKMWLRKYIRMFQLQPAEQGNHA